MGLGLGWDWDGIGIGTTPKKYKKEVLGMPGDRFEDLEVRFGCQDMDLSK